MNNNNQYSNQGSWIDFIDTLFWGVIIFLSYSSLLLLFSAKSYSLDGAAVILLCVFTNFVVYKLKRIVVQWLIKNVSTK